MTARPLAQIAMAELERRVALANDALRNRQRSAAQVQALLRPWAAIAAFVGADVRPLIVPQPGVACEARPCWIDFCPLGERAPDALRRIAEECRRATQTAIARHEAGEGDLGRAAELIRLDMHLSIAAGLGPLPPTSARPERVEGPMQRVKAA